MSRLFRTFARAARRDAGKPVLCARPGGRWMPAASVLRGAERLGAALARAGLERDRIAILAAGNKPFFVTACLAVWSRGGVLLPVEPSLQPAEMDWLRRSFRPALVIREISGRPRVEAGAAGGRPARLTSVAMIRLTSGSTGTPRGALIPESALLADGRAIVRTMRITPEDVNLGLIPLNHSYGFDNLILPMILQLTPLMLLERPLPALVFKALRGRRPSILPLVPYLVDLLARHSEVPPSRSGLRLCISAGATLPPDAAARFREKFGVPVRTFYGASEAGAIAFDDSAGADPGEGCVGTPLPGVKIRIQKLRLAGLGGGEGRVVVTGPAVGIGYHPHKSRDYAGGTFRTMDMGYLDGTGRLHLTGRMAHLVNVSGKKVNPTEVERALRSLGEVADAAVLGVVDRLRGERIEAWVVGAAGAASASIRSALSTRLAPHKIPKAIHLVASIPRTPRGKLDRVRLLAAP